MMDWASTGRVMQIQCLSCGKEIRESYLPSQIFPLHMKWQELQKTVSSTSFGDFDLLVELISSSLEY